MHGSSNAIVNDSVVQEIDVKTGLVMWEWHALGHIALSESHNSIPSSPDSPWDYVHINSISPGPASQTEAAGADQPGDVLLSSRSTWTLYDVNMRTGGFVWRLGDRGSSFKLGPGTRFYWQHDAEWQPGGLISVFDNGSDPPKEKQSRGLLLDPNTAAHTVTLVKQFTNPHYTLLASSQGNLLNLSRQQHSRQLDDGLRRAAQLHRAQLLRAPCCSTARSARTCRTSGPTCRHGAVIRRAPPRWPSSPEPEPAAAS